MRVSAAHHQGEHRKLHLVVAFLALFQQHGVDVPFQMIHPDKRLLRRVGQRLGIAQPDEQGAGQPRALGHRNCVQAGVGLARILHRLAYHGYDGAQMFARGQFRHHSTIGLVGGDLGIHHIRDQLLARAHHGRRRLVAGALDAQNVNVVHINIVRAIPGKTLRTMTGHVLENSPPIQLATDDCF